jgi:uncharacterized protein (TIRG00374 family)
MWAIAIGGIWWVIAHMSLRDRVTILNADNLPVAVYLALPATDGENSASFVIIDPVTHERRIISRKELVNLPDEKSVQLKAQSQRVPLLAVDLSDNLRTVNRILVLDAETNKGVWRLPAEVNYKIRVPHPRLEMGVITMTKIADPSLLWGAVLIFPVTFLVTSIRWNALLKALDIRLTQARTFVLNMVGAFYNTFMLGVTGGDVLKAYYASKQTRHRMGAVLSVFVDRVIGLLSLVIMGGIMATLQYFTSEHRDDPASLACLRIALGSAAVVFAFLLAVLLFQDPVRRAIGLDSLPRRLPFQKHIGQAIDVINIYRSRPLLIVGAIVFTFPVHITVVVSALFAGKAFLLPLPMLYYFVAVPVIVLSGALPISPQGAGVMEFFAIQLTKQYGTTVSQAFALTMSIRIVQMLWNLTGGFFVLRGGYHAPTASEKEEMGQPEPAV